MPYDSLVIRQAQQMLDQRRQTHQQEQALLQQEILEKLPRIGEINQEVKLSMVEVARSALMSGNSSARIVALKRRVQTLQRERSDLLLANSYPTNAMSDNPICPACGDSGWTGATMCHCLEILCQQVQIHDLSSMLDLGNQSFETFRLDYYDTEVPEGWFLSPRDTMEGVFAVCKGYADSFPNHSYKNLYLNGSPGLGKTFLSAAIARVVAAKGYSVVYDSAVNIFGQFEAKKFEKDQDAQRSTQRYLNCDLLILDDLGSEMTTSFTQSVLHEVVNTRLVTGKHTVISSNLSIPDLSQRYQPQIYSRIAGVYAPLTCLGKDIRINRNL